MHVEFAFYGTLRDAVGESCVVRSFEPGTTVTEAVRDVAAAFEAFEPPLVGPDGELAPGVAVTIDGEPMLTRDEEETHSASNAVVPAPGVACGFGAVMTG